MGKDAGEDDQTAKPRWGFQVVGTFKRLPDLVERPMCGACEVVREVIAFPGAPKPAARTGKAQNREASTTRQSDHASNAAPPSLRSNRCVAALSPQLTTAPRCT